MSRALPHSRRAILKGRATALRLVAFVLAAVASSCGGPTPGGSGPTACHRDSDCPRASFCINGACGAVPQACASDADCQGGDVCHQGSCLAPSGGFTCAQCPANTACNTVAQTCDLVSTGGDGGTSGGSDGGSGGGSEQCGSLVGPDVSAGCTGCKYGGHTCQANGCWGGWWCDTSGNKCKVEPASCTSSGGGDGGTGFNCSQCPANTTCNTAAQTCDPNSTGGTALTCPAPASYNTATTTGKCGVTRWSVKTGTDPDAGNVDLAHVQVTTIAQLAAIPAPSSRPSNGRISPLEDTVYELKDVRMTQDAMEADSDFHMVVSDGTSTMITEIPFPGCVGSGSPFACYITHARAAAEKVLKPTTSFVPVDFTATIVGVGFSDDPHARGAAATGIELHPVLAICFGQGCDPFAN